MKITKLVILFNFNKILIGLIVSIISFVLANFLSDYKLLFILIGLLILINILLSIVAAYFLYDTSDLYKLKKLPDYINLNEIKNGVFLHASFDPVSIKLQEEFKEMGLVVCDLYENRHEHESAIKISKKEFPPNPKEIKVEPTNLPFKDNSQDVIFAITAIHEILEHNKRVLFFNEAKRVLKDDGIIILSEQMRDFTNFLFFNIGAFHFLSKKKWKLAIKESGLKIVETQKITVFSERLIIKKGIAESRK